MHSLLKQIYNKIISNPIISIIIIQSALVLIAFNKIIFQPNEFMFINFADGLKNYFTFLQFIAQEPSEKGIFHFTQMNYPFGEYIFFTDNTPFLSLIVKFINNNLFTVENCSLAIHNYFFISIVFASPIAFYCLITPSKKELVLMSIIISICVVWVNPQSLKFVYGVYNLSIFLFIILALILIKNVFQAPHSIKKISLIATCIAILIFFSGLFHIYYVPIIAALIGSFTFFFYTINVIATKKLNLWSPFLISLAIIIGGLALYFSIQNIDEYSSLRKSGASGYDWEEWKFTPEALITPYRFNTLQPIIRSCKSYIPSESHGFLGNFIFFLLPLSALIFLTINSSLLSSIKSLYKFISFRPALIALGLTAFLTYFISMGNYIHFCFTNKLYTNYFSPFFYLHDKIDFITQFRCLGRFSWVGFWIVFYLSTLLFFKLYEILNKRNKKIAFIITFVLLTILLIDTKDSIKYLNSVYQPNLFKKGLITKRFEHESKNIIFSDFQAIYTIPMVNVGSEDYSITIDDQSDWTEYWMQLSTYSKLPLFNTKMSRTALNQAQAKINLVLEEKVPEIIMNKLTDAPILVVYSPKHETNFNLHVDDHSIEVALNGSKIINAFKMDTLLFYNEIYYLSWDVKKNN